MLEHAAEQELIDRLGIVHRREEVAQLQREGRMAELIVPCPVRQRRLVAQVLVDLQVVEIEARDRARVEHVAGRLQGDPVDRPAQSEIGVGRGFQRVEDLPPQLDADILDYSETGHAALLRASVETRAVRQIDPGKLAALHHAFQGKLQNAPVDRPVLFRHPPERDALGGVGSPGVRRDIGSNARRNSLDWFRVIFPSAHAGGFALRESMSKSHTNSRNFFYLS
jgi:hypothetical protein